MTHHFCTLFDRNYLSRGLALYRSLERHCPDFTLHILCMDGPSHELLGRLQLRHAALITLDDLEDPALRRVKPTRTVAEYCWTCTPSLTLHVLERTAAAPAVTYLDADILFFSTPEVLFAEAGSAPITVHEHAFSPRLAGHQQASGRFNVGWVGFHRADQGFECLDRWRRQCLEWCHARAEGEKYGDQKYLDEWPSLYPDLHILGNEGAGVGPWNMESRRIVERAGRAFVNDDELVFFHFHGFRLFRDLTAAFADAEYRIFDETRRLIYEPYVEALREAMKELQALVPGFACGLHEPTSSPGVRAQGGHGGLTRQLARLLTWARRRPELERDLPC